MHGEVYKQGFAGLTVKKCDVPVVPYLVCSTHCAGIMWKMCWLAFYWA